MVRQVPTVGLEPTRRYAARLQIGCVCQFRHAGVSQRKMTPIETSPSIGVCLFHRLRLPCVSVQHRLMLLRHRIRTLPNPGKPTPSKNFWNYLVIRLTDNR